RRPRRRFTLRACESFAHFGGLAGCSERNWCYWVAVGTGLWGSGLVPSEKELFGDLPEQRVPEASGRGTPRLRQPERRQLGWHAATLDDLVARDHPVRAVWGFVQGLDLRALHDAVKAREGGPGQAPPAPGLQEGDGVACMRARRSPPP